ncbi:hypothetical protein NEOC95_002002 [Neochlamydia sp. AcF95]|nr:hypothetical protein [Neochlamydia sp. AcF95]
MFLGKIELKFLMIFNTADSTGGERFGILLTQICLAKHSQVKTYTNDLHYAC